jgi:nucleoid-associated protein YgaU
MPKDDISHLPPNVQASIKAAREKAEKEEAKKERSADRGNPTVPEQARAAMAKAKGVRQDVQGAVDKVLAQRAAKKKEKTYVVQPGDSLSKIAKEKLGDAARWPEIFELNKDQIKDPNLIHVGQELRLP